jgi:hypothetical protein
MLVFAGSEKSPNVLFLLQQFLRRFRPAGLTPAMILGMHLHEGKAAVEAILRKSGEFGKGFLSEGIARFWRSVRIAVN